jgi:hypothetical protein
VEIEENRICGVDSKRVGAGFATAAAELDLHSARGTKHGVKKVRFHAAAGS